MNANVKIDYDTADKIMDLDGCGSRHTAAPGHARRPRRSKVYVKTIGDKTSMKIMVSFCPTFGGEICHNSEFRADDPRLQLGQVRPQRASPQRGPVAKKRKTNKEKCKKESERESAVIN